MVFLPSKAQLSECRGRVLAEPLALSLTPSAVCLANSEHTIAIYKKERNLCFLNLFLSLKKM